MDEWRKGVVRRKKGRRKTGRREKGRREERRKMRKTLTEEKREKWS